MYTRDLFLGTGIVTSVPSDAPDDYAALRDVKNKAVSKLLLIVHACGSVSFKF